MTCFIDVLVVCVLNDEREGQTLLRLEGDIGNTDGIMVQTRLDGEKVCGTTFIIMSNFEVGYHVK